MSVFVGRLLIVVGLCLQAYLLLADQPTITGFKKELATTIGHHKFIPPQLAAILKDYLHIAVASLLFSSVLMVVSKSVFSKLMVLMGLMLLMLARYDPVHRVPGFKERSFWQLAAMMGGVIYLMGIERTSRKELEAEKEE